MHHLLVQQIRRALGESPEIPEPMLDLLKDVSRVYTRLDPKDDVLAPPPERAPERAPGRDDAGGRAEPSPRGRAEQKLDDHQAQTEAILAALPDMLLVISPHDELLEIHAPTHGIFAEPAAAMRGRSAAEALPSELYRALVPAMDAAKRRRQPQRCEVSWAIGPTRHRYEARLTVSTSGDVIAVLRDQTERMHMAERLRVADRMASVGTLAAGVAHELNNPLAYVLGNLELLRQRLRATWVEPTQLQVLVDEAYGGACRMREITEDLRTFSQPHTDVVEPIDPRAVLDSALKIAGTEIRHRAELRRDYAPVPAVRAEAGKLGQVFLNLVINAVQALPMGEAARHQILVGTRTDEHGHAVIEVSDTGPGIPMHLVSRIFEPFVTTKPREVGTGLGLSICHNIVTSLGGRISTHAREPRGTTFRVRLPPSDTPLPRPSPAARPEAPAAGEAPVSADRRVLIIDDDPLVASALSRLLANRDVEVAGSGRRGIEMLREGDGFEVVLCDLMMPEVSGMDVYETILEEDPDQARRFIFMTGGAFTTRARTFLESVPNPKLEKPFDSKTLRRMVAHHGSER